jgi:hypothetical protein
MIVGATEIELEVCDGVRLRLETDKSNIAVLKIGSAIYDRAV